MFKDLKYPIAIVIGTLILGGFYSYTENTKQASIERQVQMQIDQENHLKEVEQEQKAKDAEALQAQQVAEAKIKSKCSSYLDRNGNYLVSNETLTTNYNACLHANGL